MSSDDQARIFNTWLDNQLKEKDWTDFKLATNAGLSHAVIGKARKGFLPKYRACAAIANALEVPLEEVLRNAGLLTTNPEKQERLKYFLDNMNDNEIDEMENFAKFLFFRRKNQAGKAGEDPGVG